MSLFLRPVEAPPVTDPMFSRKVEVPPITDPLTPGFKVTDHASDTGFAPLFGAGADAAVALFMALGALAISLRANCVAGVRT